MAKLPRQVVPSRICSVVVGKRADGLFETCRETAAYHLFWETISPAHNSYECEEHYEKGRQDKQQPLFRHRMGGCCGMPGSFFKARANKCYCSGDLPVREVDRERELEYA